MKRGSEVATFAAYLLISAVFFSRLLWNHFSTRIVGVGTDPTIYIWFLQWWPYAIWHHLNPFFTTEIFAPEGINVTWTTCLPLAALVASPITAIWGPVTAYNILCLLSPPLAAWASFRLCYYLTRRYWPAFLGGYIFGFSTYMLAELRGHLVETLIFPIPLIVLVVLQRLRNEISPNRFSASMVALLLTQFLLSIEQMATLTFLGIVAVVVAWLVFDSETRSRILSLIPLIALSYALAAALLIPYEYCMFAYGFPHQAAWSSVAFSQDLVNFVVPTPVNLVGMFSWFETFSRQWGGNVFEDSAFFGWPLTGLALWFGISRWRSRSARMLVICLFIFCIFALGPALQISAVRGIWLPWKLIEKLPLMSSALPCRLIAFAFLILAVIAAIWIDTTMNPFVAASFVVLAVACLLPNFRGSYWTRSADSPEFFSRDIYRQYVKPGDVVWALPPGDFGDSMLWQAQSNMYFRMAEGNAGPDQDWMRQWRPKWTTLRQSDELEFLANSNVTAIIVSPWVWQYRAENGPLQPWLRSDIDFLNGVESMLSALGLTASKVGNVNFYPVPNILIAPFKLPRDELEARMLKSLESRVNNALSYAVSCVPASQPFDGIDAKLWGGLNGAASVPPTDPYSRDFKVSVSLGPTGDLVFLVTAADRNYLDQLEKKLTSLVRPESMWITSFADSFELSISLNKPDLVKVVPPHRDSCS